MSGMHQRSCCERALELNGVLVSHLVARGLRCVVGFLLLNQELACSEGMCILRMVQRS